ncbi:glycosyltransferase family 2 protein [Candidatus Viridilinea mediisalina]|uniref:Glycosyltransferase 2-like domain-containing protein n=1 Tax=Candidatus Viridilinea mediisalina TaxID=2024553 RepID=A0A2A6RL94_9CHLR|nr:glycosyltransferase [Candidatus Viridilinea mediisalina]PDW03884.1 hypothetical protein CJ255_06430 [Candidatus Viridilinea mediisalina]
MISVVIPNLNSPLIAEVIAALERQTIREQITEVIVVGQDREQLVPKSVRHVEVAQPLSAAAARNRGARLATGAYLCFLDADCIASPQFVERLLARLQAGASMVGGSITPEPGNYWRICDNLLVFASVLASARPGERPYLPSLNVMLQRDLFIALGGFDERFPGAAGEDIDFSLRLRNQGHTLWFEPEATIFHRPARSSAASVAAHLRSFGRVHVRLQREHQGRAAPRLGPHLRPWSGLLMACAPLLALLDALLLYGRNPELRRYWYCLPGMIWGKAAWYLGVVEGMLAVESAKRL